ncbi:MAG: DciA family protein [Rubrivivax sp.]|nr:DciA family protein [Rubrivivax sp.]
MSNAILREQSVAAALGRSEPLSSLLQRMRASKARLEAIAPLLPPGLADGIRAGPLDDSAWVLLVSHAAAAAKLRQMLPALESTLREHGWPGPPIKIKVLPRA